MLRLVCFVSTLLCACSGSGDVRDQAVVTRGAPIRFLLDIDGWQTRQGLSYSVVEPPSHGQVSPGVGAPHMLYIPQPGFVGTVEIKYELVAGGVGTGVVKVKIEAPAGPFPPNAKADVIFYNGRFITVDPKKPRARAVAVKDGRILKVGCFRSVMKKTFKPGSTRLHNMKRRTVLPGLVDAHTHPVLTSGLENVADLSAFTWKTAENVLRALRGGIAQTMPGSLYVGFGWDPAQLPDLEWPTLAELDAMAPTAGVVIVTQNIHMVMVNSFILAAVGITNQTPDPPGGLIEKDADGELTGRLIEPPAFESLFELLPAAPTGLAVLSIRKVLQGFAKAGYTTVVDPGVRGLSAFALDDLYAAQDVEEAPVSVTAYPFVTDFVPELGFYRNENFNVANGVKIPIDGSPYTGGMALEEPYLNNPFAVEQLAIAPGTLGQLVFKNTTVLIGLVQQFHKAGLQIVGHVQGDRAAEQFLDAIAFAQSVAPRPDARHRMEHCALVTREQLARAKALGVTVSFFIDHITFYGDTLRDFIVGPERAERYMAMQTAVDLGHTVSLHTDSPATPLGPFRSMVTSILRRTPSGRVLGANESISAMTAIKAMTIAPAWQMFKEDSIGSIEVGKQADFTVISRDPLRLPVDKWDTIEVLATYKSGRRVNLPDM